MSESLMRNIRCPHDKGLLHGDWGTVTCDVCGSEFHPFKDSRLTETVRRDEVMRFTTTRALVAMTIGHEK
jgi:hypothetical protein